jgi:hypothetical protein
MEVQVEQQSHATAQKAVEHVAPTLKVWDMAAADALPNWRNRHYHARSTGV